MLLLKGAMQWGNAEPSHVGVGYAQVAQMSGSEEVYLEVGRVRSLQKQFVGCCFACGCVLELVECRVRFARGSCPRLRFENRNSSQSSPVNVEGASVSVCVCHAKPF